MLCTTFNAEPNRYIDLKKMMHRQEQSISLTSFLSWFKLDRKCIYNLAAVHNNPSVAKTWTLNRLGKSIWSYYWHFLSNLNNTWKPLQGVQPWALTKFPDFSLTFPWPFCGFPWPWDILSAFHYCLNTNFASNLTNHSPKVAITK